MNLVPLSEFKAHCSRYINELGDEELVITKSGKAVARLNAAEDTLDLWDVFGALEGKVYVDPKDDLLSAYSPSEAQPQPRFVEVRR